MHYYYLDCTRIKSDKELEKLLKLLPARVSYDNICRGLNIERAICNELARSKNLNLYNIAEEYLNQNADPCWENIIRHLCQDFDVNRLANEVAKTHNILYSKYCGTSGQTH